MSEIFNNILATRCVPNQGQDWTAHSFNKQLRYNLEAIYNLHSQKDFHIYWKVLEYKKQDVKKNLKKTLGK